MNAFTRLVFIALCALMCVAMDRSAAGQSAVYEGQLHTTNRKLDGAMTTCAVTEVGNEKWQGRSE